MLKELFGRKPEEVTFNRDDFRDQLENLVDLARRHRIAAVDIASILEQKAQSEHLRRATTARII